MKKSGTGAEWKAFRGAFPFLIDEGVALDGKRVSIPLLMPL